MAKNFSDMAEIHIEIKEVEQIPNRINPKR